MHRSTLALIVGFAGLTAGCRPGSPPGSASEIRVLVYNIHAGKDAAGVDNLAGVAALVRETRADIALLQEVDSVTRRSGGVDQTATLAASTGLYAAFGSALDYDGGEYGVALLSRWPIVDHELIHLPVDPPQDRAGGSREPRGALRVRIAAPAGTLTVINTHLDASAEDRWRRQEARQVATIAHRAREASPLVLAGGDFNSTPESAVQVELRNSGLRDAHAECGTGDGHTYPANAPVRRIDYLYLTGSLRCTSVRVIETPVSDHRPLLVVVTLDRTAGDQ